MAPMPWVMLLAISSNVTILDSMQVIFNFENTLKGDIRKRFPVRGKFPGLEMESGRCFLPGLPMAIMASTWV